MAKRATMQNQVAFADNSALARKKPQPTRITTRVKRAVEHIVETGAAYNEAAAHVGMSTYRLRLALDKPHVIAFMRSRLHVSRELRSPKNFHRLCEIADAENNMPAVNAIKALEQLSDEQTNTKQTTSPGVTIRIVNIAAQPQHEQTNKNDYSTTNLDNMLITNDTDLSTKQINDD